jgi:hypothetical protein
VTSETVVPRTATVQVVVGTVVLLHQYYRCCCCSACDVAAAADAAVAIGYLQLYSLAKHHHCSSINKLVSKTPKSNRKNSLFYLRLLHYRSTERRYKAVVTWVLLSLDHTSVHMYKQHSPPKIQ